MNTCVWRNIIVAFIVVDARPIPLIEVTFRPLIGHNNCTGPIIQFMHYFVCHTLTLKYRNVLHTNMADDALMLILANHGERLTSIESDVHDIRTGIEQIKDSPIFTIERYVRRKVAQTGGVIGLVLLAFTAFTQ
jgi:hypothetical protein